MKAIWSPTADRNADAIWEYIAQDNIDAADKMIALFHAAAARLEDFPLMGEAAGPAAPASLSFRGRHTSSSIESLEATSK
jgi:toxin ParE1/3/4